MQKGKKNIAPIRLEMLITIVDKKKADFYADLIQTFQVNMQMILAAKGTAEEKMLEYLGLSKNEKSVIFSLVREDRLMEILGALEDRFASVKGGKGVAVSIPLSSIMGASAFGFLSNELPRFGLTEEVGR
ncbi:MAG: hypothetical protein E7295_07265 [Lachnospiraceae bacterium]|nr:hypothetical protein [Lachnospiraceae bacterium]